VLAVFQPDARLGRESLRCCVSAFALWATVGIASAQGAPLSEAHTDRPGFDYQMFALELDGIATIESTCQELCTRDVRCKAWTAVVIGVQGPIARCWLKAAIPAARPNGCCTSGVPVRAFEPGVDRPGSDYKLLDLHDTDPTACQAACQSDKQCRAWTYVRPGVQGPNARCWLKDFIPAASSNECCTSGARAVDAK
jgi:hypothetical protein